MNSSLDAKLSDLRDGEVAAALPEHFDASVYFIGRIRTPWKTRKDCPKNAREARETGAVCTIELDPRWAAGLKDLERCSHLVVLYWMDKARRDLVVQVPGHLGKGRGTFALRSPVRPNPIAMSVVKLVKIDGPKLEVIAMDCIDGTPLLDIKPYFASTDSIPDARAVSHTGRKD
jgi:tRNA-Thr(GGU) m(6)t(6)A37 methyltransferase TsaA